METENFHAELDDSHFMGRKPRVIPVGLPCHVITRGNNRRRLFSSHSEYMRCIRYMESALSLTDVKLHSLTLMANHIHQILTTSSSNDLARYMQHWSQRYAVYRNRITGGSGKAFEERFLSLPIQSSEQMAVATAYVDVNAWRAGLVAKPEQHRWSTCAIHLGRAHLSRIPQRMITPSDWYLGLGTNPQKRADEYRAIIVRFYIGSVEPEYSAGLAHIEVQSWKRDHKRLKRPDGHGAR